MATRHHPARRAPTHNAQPGQPPERQSASDERKLREERLLDVATTLMVRWGYRKTTLDDVAREAGVGKGTIYLHWKDKNELFRAAMWRASRQASADMMRRGAPPPAGGGLFRRRAPGRIPGFFPPLPCAPMKSQTRMFHA